MKKHRRKHAPEFKARVALEAIQGLKTANEIAAEFEIHPVMVSNWKKEMLSRLPELFESKDAKKEHASIQEKEALHRKVGQLAMEVDFLEKKCKQLGIPGKGRNS
jgi:transposase-like protein